MIKLTVAGGLANRIKPIVSAYRVAQILDHELVVQWLPYIDWWPRPGEEIKIPFEVPWSIISDVPIKFSTFDFNDEDVSVVPRHLEKNDVITLRTWKWVHLDNEPEVDLCSLDIVNEKLMRDIQSYVEFFFGSVYESDFAYGVHYRRWHHHINTPVSTIINLLEENDGEDVFFATDDKVTHDFAKSHYKHVATNDKLFDIRLDVLNGATMADLRSLARCRQMYASTQSTFAELAWYMGNFQTFSRIE